MAEIVTQIVALVGHLVWPATVLTLAYFTREQLRRLIEKFIERVADPNTNVEVTTEGVKITHRIESKVESLEADREQLLSLMMRVAATENPAPVTRGGPPRSGISEALRRQADEYMAIDIKNHGARVRAKDKLAVAMAEVVLTTGVSRDELAEQDHQGLILALAGAVHTDPLPGDGARLLKSVHKVDRLHVKYRIAMAFGRLADKGVLADEELQPVRDALERFKLNADRALLTRIERSFAELDLAQQDNRETST